MRKHVFVVTGAEAGVSLAELLVRRLDLTRKQAAARIDGGSVYVDRRRQREASTPVAPGQKVVVHEPSEQDAPAPELQVAHLDREVVVVVKPAGVHSVPGRRGGGSSVQQLAEQRWGAGARLLHRLDRQASGLLLVSRKPGKARRSLADQISSRRLGRRYLALVSGAPKQDELVIDAALAVDAGVTRASQDPRARRAVSRVHVVRRGLERSLLQVTLDTGRTHQIRAHLSGAGLPILGDERYGGTSAPRLALHAHCLIFRHPRTKETLELHSPLPRSLRALI